MDPFPSDTLISIVLLFIIALLRLVQVSVDSVSEARLSKLADTGDKTAKKALKMVENSLKVYNCLKNVIIFAELLIAGILTISACKFISDFNLQGYEIPVMIVFVIVTGFIIQLFGIYIPQKIASSNAEKIMFSFMWLITLSYYFSLPMVKLLSFLSSVILMPFGLKASDDEDDEVTEEEIRFMVDVGSESGAIDPDEKEMIHNIFELDDTPIKDVMTHRTDVVFLWKEDGLDVWEETVSSSNHTIYPICGETVDDIVGVLRTNDFYKLLRNNENPSGDDVLNIIKSPYLVPETMKADDLFRQMQQCKNHFGVVVDEYGGLAGIITMSDLLSEIVGDIDNDESDEEDDIVELDSNTWKISGSTDIDLVSKVLNIDLPIEEYNTFAGMVLGELGAIPDDGTTVEVEAYGLMIKVTKIFEHRIDETIVCKIEQDKPQDEQE